MSHSTSGTARGQSAWRNGTYPPGDVLTDRSPPQSLEAEEGALGSILLDPGLLPEIRAILAPEDFYLDLHGAIFNALCRMHDRGDPIDALTVTDRLRGDDHFARVDWEDKAYRLMAVPSAANGTYYASIVRDRAEARRVIDLADGLLRDAYAGRHSGADLAQLAQTRAVRVAEGALHALQAKHAGVMSPDEEPVTARPWPAPPEPIAFRGLAGEYAEALREHSEADPIGVLVQLTVAFGNLVGRWPFFRVNATRHYPNLNVVTVGPTGLGRKGLALDVARSALDGCDPDWSQYRIQKGLSSGEGLITAVRDPVTKSEAIKEKGRITGYQDVIVDEGVADKRLLVVSTEMSRTFKVMNREFNILSDVIRELFDTGDVSILRNQSIRATAAHVSIVGHITDVEAARYLRENEAANGFGNRFLWACVRMGPLLPFGGQLPGDVEADFRRRFAAVRARTADFALDGPFEVPLAADAEDLWIDFYGRVHRPRHGFLGHMAARAAPITRRLAMIGALLDGVRTIRRVHLEAAIALWDYSERSVVYTFGDSLGDPDSDRVLDAIRAAEGGLAQKAIYEKVFAFHRTSREIAALLGRLREAGLVRSEKIPTAGRPVTVWFATGPTREETTPAC